MEKCELGFFFGGDRAPTYPRNRPLELSCRREEGHDRTGGPTNKLCWKEASSSSLRRASTTGSADACCRSVLLARFLLAAASIDAGRLPEANCADACILITTIGQSFKKLLPGNFSAVCANSRNC